MGNRTIVGYKKYTGAPTLYVYLHWSSFANGLQDAQKALEHAYPRWGDHSYAMRMAVSQLTHDAYPGEYGAGLAIDDFTSPDYNLWAEINWDAKWVEIWERKYIHQDNDYVATDPKIVKYFTFDDFLGLTPEEITEMERNS